jgi:putative membrane protein
MIITKYLSTFGLLTASVMLVFAQSKSSNLDSTDRKFVTAAAAGGLAEVQLGQLAQTKGSNQAVRDFGSQMVKDHSNANDQLKGIASNKGVAVADKMNAKDQALYDRLSKLSGSQFDRAYMDAMVRDHREDVSEFRRESRAGKDTDVKTFASSTLPTLEHHLQMAEQAQKQLGASSAR